MRYIQEDRPLKIEEVEFAIFDTETTGLNPEQGDRIVELAGIRIKGDKVIDSFQTLVNPQREISWQAYLVNQITTDMLKDAPLMKEVAPKFLEFIKGSCLCSYNAPFDMGFLEAELKMLGLILPEDIFVVDILRMARRLIPGLTSYSLSSVGEFLKFDIQQKHRAMSDVELTLKVFFYLKELMFKQGIFYFDHLLGLFGLSHVAIENMQNQKISRIQEAIELKLGLEIRYLDSQGKVFLSKIVPKDILQKGLYNYLVAHSLLSNEECNFRIDRIVTLEIIKEECKE